jgi:hypothetical protein
MGGRRASVLGLVEPFDLALCLRVSWRSVLLDDAEQCQQVFECVAAAAEAGGVDPGVVGQRARGSAVITDDVEKDGHHVVPR